MRRDVRHRWHPRGGLVVAAAIVLGACGAKPQEAPGPLPARPSVDDPGDRTAMFIQVEGPLDALRGLVRLPGMDFSRGVRDLGGGRYRAGAYVTSKAAVQEVRARGLTVVVVMDEEETRRRMEHPR